MLLDKIKSIALAVGLGLVATILACCAGLPVVAAHHGVTVRDALLLAHQQPVRYWPGDLRMAMAIAMAAGTSATVLLN